MSKTDAHFEHLVKEEREACARSKRLNSYRSTVVDEGIRAAARQVCDDAKEAVRRYLRKHLG